MAVALAELGFAETLKPHLAVGHRFPAQAGAFFQRKGVALYLAQHAVNPVGNVFIETAGGFEKTVERGALQGVLA